MVSGPFREVYREFVGVSGSSTVFLGAFRGILGAYRRGLQSISASFYKRLRRFQRTSGGSWIFRLLGTSQGISRCNRMLQKYSRDISKSIRERQDVSGGLLGVV